MKLRISCLLLLLCIPLICSAKDKNTVPDYVLQAHTVQIIIDPNANESLDHPTASTDAREQVRHALQAWGRFDIVFEGQAIWSSPFMPAPDASSLRSSSKEPTAESAPFNPVAAPSAPEGTRAISPPTAIPDQERVPRLTLELRSAEPMTPSRSTAATRPTRCAQRRFFNT